MHHLLSFENLVAFLTLTAMEIVLGIDNIVFLAIVTGKLDLRLQARARTLGLSGAMLMRIGLLFAITWIMGLTRPLFEILGRVVTGRDLILLAGGVFLIAKATSEIHERIEPRPTEPGAKDKPAPGFAAAIVQIMLLDVVFSFDSVLTAVGMARDLPVMVAAVMASVGIMLIFSGPVCAFVERHPTVKMLALSFLLLIGVMLTAEGWGRHIEKGYIYVAMAFALFVEMLNLRVRKTAAAHS